MRLSSVPPSRYQDLTVVQKGGAMQGTRIVHETGSRECVRSRVIQLRASAVMEGHPVSPPRKKYLAAGKEGRSVIIPRLDRFADRRGKFALNRAQGQQDRLRDFLPQLVGDREREQSGSRGLECGDVPEGDPV